MRNTIVAKQIILAMIKTGKFTSIHFKVNLALLYIYTNIPYNMYASIICTQYNLIKNPWLKMLYFQHLEYPFRVNITNAQLIKIASSGISSCVGIHKHDIFM